MNSLDRLIDAAERGDLAQLRSAISGGADVNGRTSSTGPALCSAAAAGHTETVEVLLDAGADMRATDTKRRSALAWAVFKERPAVVRLLLERGAGDTLQALNEADGMLDEESDEKRLVRELLRNARTGIAEKVVRKGQDSASRMIRAAFNGDVAEMELALDDGEGWWDKDEYGMDALAWAARQGHHEAVKFLLEQHPDPDREDSVNEPPLGQASKDGFNEVVRALVDADVDVDHIFKDGRTALMHAAEQGHMDIVRLLLDAEADKSIACEGATAYNLAMANGHTAILELLR